MRLAAVLRRPVVFMAGLYLGGNRYEVRFEPLADFSALPEGGRAGRDALVHEAIERYARCLERNARRAPYNWFNFHDFWAPAPPRWRASPASRPRSSPRACRHRVGCVGCQGAHGPAGETRPAATQRDQAPRCSTPVRSSGELRFVPPRCLERRTTAPGRGAHRGRRFARPRTRRAAHDALDEGPARIAVLVESIRATLAGDRATLETLHALSVAGGIEGWTLTLLPRTPTAARLVTRIDVSGKQARIHRIEIQMVGGDRSLMMIRKAGP
jgi:hypothetical protein